MTDQIENILSLFRAIGAALMFGVIVLAWLTVRSHSLIFGVVIIYFLLAMVALAMQRVGANGTERVAVLAILTAVQYLLVYSIARTLWLYQAKRERESHAERAQATAAVAASSRILAAAVDGALDERATNQSEGAANGNNTDL